MKKPVVVTAIVACLALLAAGPLVTGSSADNLPNSQLTTPQHPNGWTESIISQSTGAATGSVEYTTGPRVPNAQGDTDITPHGAGSLTLRTGSNQDTLSRMQHDYLDGAPVAGTDIDYSWITIQRSDTSESPAPALELTVTGPGGRDTLIYEPYFNRASLVTTEDVWQRDDAGTGLWWRRAVGPDGEGNLFTLQTYATTINQGATVVTDQPGGAFAVRAGCCSEHWPNFVGAVDDVLLQRGGSSTRTTYDFEPTIFNVRPDWQESWTFSATGAGSTVDLVEGPGNPFFGTGSLRLTVGSNGANTAEARSPFFDNSAMADIEALSYGTYVASRALSDGCAEAPYLLLDTIRVAQEGEPATGHQLIFHPCEQFDDGSTPAGVPLATWQRWDAGRGEWRWEEENPVVQAIAEENLAVCAGSTCTGTLAEYQATYPGDETVADTSADGGSLHIGAGGGDATNPNGDGTRWANFVGHADFLARDHADTAGGTYDFEAQAPPPPTTTSTTTTTTVSDTTTTTVVRTTTTTAPGDTTTTTAGDTTTTTQQPTSAQVSRLSGTDRIATAIEISRRHFPDRTAGAVVLARADNYPDALAATPLAADRGGPLLLTPSNSMDSRVEAEIQRVLPQGGIIHLAGGTNAIGTEVETRLRAAGYNVVRHAGRNRFETATLLAEQIGAPTAVYLATGLSFADALPAGAAAAATRGVVVLTAGSNMSAEAAAYLNARPGIRRIAVGGPASAADRGAESVVGADRFHTAANLARHSFTRPVSIGVASGANFPDALGGGTHAGSRGGPLLLTRPESLSEPARQYLVDSRDSLRNVFIYGGPNAVSSQTETEIRSATS